MRATTTTTKKTSTGTLRERLRPALAGVGWRESRGWIVYEISGLYGELRSPESALEGVIDRARALHAGKAQSTLPYAPHVYDQRRTPKCHL